MASSTSLLDLLNYTPDPLLQSPDYFPYPSRLSPVTFYDKHLDSSLILKHVRPIPGPLLSKRLKDIVDQALQNPALSHDILLSEVVTYKCEDTDTDTVSGAVSVAHSYQRGFSDAVIKVASTLLSPSPPDKHWSSVLQWCSNQRLPSEPEGLYSAEYSLQIPPIDIKESHNLDVNSKTLLQKLVSSDNRAELAIWEIFAVTAEDLIRNMGSGDALSSFHWDTCMDQGVPPSLTRTTKPLDAPASPLLANIAQRDFDRSPLTIRLKPSSKRTPAKGKSKNKTTSTSTIHERNHPKPPRQRGPDPHHFLQHAWTRAVINDATFIIFRCGNLERIGIRHRQSQTLYLSEPIEIADCEDPAYGKLQVGLYLAILQDLESRLRPDLLLDEASDRDAAGRNRETPKAAGKKRALEESDHDRTSKKQKFGNEEHENTNPIPDFESTSAQAEVSSRNAAFIRLQYGVYQSPVLAPFLRTNPDLSPSRVQIYSKRFRPPRQKATYLPREYFTITLGPQVHNNDDTTTDAEDLPNTSHIATHTATLELALSDQNPQTVCHKNVLVKLGFSSEEKQMLRHEYRVYERLARRGVKLTVPYVFGMFQSSDSAVHAPLALVLTNDGEALSSMEDSTRRMQKGSPDHCHGKVKVSPTEKATLFAALAAIHRAGVLHGNIHPSNLRISRTTGAVQITNFGDARLDSDVVDGDLHARERQQLKQLLVVEATEVHFQHVKPLTLGLRGGRYFETGSDDNRVDDDDSDVHWSQESGVSLLIND